MAEERTFRTAQEAIDFAMPTPGWTIVGQRPYYVTEPNVGEDGGPPPANQPQTKAVQRGFIYSVRGPEGQPDEVTLGAGPLDESGKPRIGDTVKWNNEPGAPLPVTTLVVVKGPSNQPTTTTATASPPEALQRLDAQMKPVGPDQPAVYVRDPKAPASTPPFKLDPDAVTSDPSKWKILKHPTTEEPMAYVDPANNKVMATIAPTPDKKATGTYDNVYDPNDPTKKRIIGMVDKGDPSIYRAVSADPNLPQRQIVTTPTAVYAVAADNTVTKLFDIDKNSPFQAVIVDGKPYRFDPNAGTFTAGPVNEHPDIKDQNGLTMVWTPDEEGGGKYAYPPGVEPAKTMTGAGTTSKYLIWYNAQTGQEISRTDNPNYEPTQPTLPQVNTTAPQIPIVDPDKPGQIKWIPNPGRVMAPQALTDLAAQLSGVVVDPNNPLTLEDAKAIIDAANAQMTSATNAATTAMQSAQQGAATGAGILNQRAATAQGLVGQGLNLFQGNRDITAPLPGIGSQLTQGAAAFATELGGGQEVYDTAARLVKAADPQGGNPMMSAAAATLTQVMNRYKQATGQDHPLVQATKAAQQSQTANALVAPGTPVVSPAVVSPQVFQAQFDPRLNPAAPQQPAGTVLPAGVAGTVAPDDPRRRRSMMAGFVAPETLLEMVT
jgi:hypothetical protein